MAVLGFDLSPLRSAITELGQGVRQGVQQQQQGDGGGDYLGFLSGIGRPAQQASLDTLSRIVPPGGGPSFFGAGSGAAQGVLNSPAFQTLGALGQMGLPGGGHSVWDDLRAYGDYTAQQASVAAARSSGQQAASQAAGAPGATGGATYTGLPADVAKWADQTNQTFGDQGGWVPAAMLALIQHESEGNPGAYNGASAGGAWGLFQQMGLGSNDPATQFAAAKKLLQDKLAMINASYQRLGINPDDRTRARDLFLAWAGQFDPATAGPNGNRDEGNGQDAEAFLNGPRGIMPMYDNVVKGRQQAVAPGGGGGGSLAGITPGAGGQIMQDFGVTPTSDGYRAAGNHVYDYGSAYGMAGGGHPGVDWAVPRGTQVATPLAGTVSIVGNDHGTGYYYQDSGNPDRDHSGEFAITLANGDILILGHLSQINAQVGQQVNAGTLIGASGGSDGDHVHVEYRQRQADGSYRVIDPRTVLGG